MSGSLRRSSRIKNKQKPSTPKLQPNWDIGPIENGLIYIELTNGDEFEDHPLDHPYKYFVRYQTKNGNWSQPKTKNYKFPPKPNDLGFYLKAMPGSHLKLSIKMVYETETFESKSMLINVAPIQTKSSFQPNETVHYHSTNKLRLQTGTIKCILDNDLIMIKPENQTLSHEAVEYAKILKIGRKASTICDLTMDDDYYMDLMDNLTIKCPLDHTLLSFSNVSEHEQWRERWADKQNKIVDDLDEIDIESTCDICRVELGMNAYHCQLDDAGHDFHVNCIYAYLTRHTAIKAVVDDCLGDILSDESINYITQCCINKITCTLEMEQDSNMIYNNDNNIKEEEHVVIDDDVSVGSKRRIDSQRPSKRRRFNK